MKVKKIKIKYWLYEEQLREKEYDESKGSNQTNYKRRKAAVQKMKEAVKNRLAELKTRADVSQQQPLVWQREREGYYKIVWWKTVEGGVVCQKDYFSVEKRKLKLEILQ